MRRNRKLAAVIFLVMLLIAAFQFFGVWQEPATAGGGQDVSPQGGEPAEQTTAGVPLTTTVSKVIDGDTIVTAGGEHVRLIGINSRERGEACYTEAKDKLAGLVADKNIRLEFGAELRDKYARLLAYIYGDKNNFVNMEMVKAGFAYAYPYKPNTEFAQEFAEAEKEAENSHKGCLWGG